MNAKVESTPTCHITKQIDGDLEYYFAEADDVDQIRPLIGSLGEWKRGSVSESL